MTTQDLIEILERARVRPTYYSIGKEIDDTLCLIREKQTWTVFRSERGQRYDVVTFVLEDNACVYFLKTIFELTRFA